MKKLIEEYEAAREALDRRITELRYQLKNDDTLRSMDREDLMRRIAILREEQYELLLSVIEMRSRR